MYIGGYYSDNQDLDIFGPELDAVDSDDYAHNGEDDESDDPDWDYTDGEQTPEHSDEDGEDDDDEIPDAAAAEQEALTAVNDEEMEIFYAELKTAHGFKMKGVGRGKLRRKGDGMEKLSQEVKELLGQASSCYVMADWDGGIEWVKKAIKIDPTPYTAWKLLGELFEGKGDRHRCLQAWLTAAHARPKNADQWMQCARMSLQQYGPDKMNYRDQAIYCYNRAVSSNPELLEAIYDRSDLYREMGNLPKAAEGFVTLNRLIPSEMTVLRELANIFIQLGLSDEAIEHYQRTVEYFRTKHNEKNAFGWSELNILMELYCMSKRWDEGLRQVKGIARWLLGRGSEKYWDKVTADDREWDLSDQRRKKISQYKAGAFQSDKYAMPLDLRVRMGLCRLRLGNKDEALMHIAFLMDPEVDIESYADTFQEVGDALLAVREYDEAIRYYFKLAESDVASDERRLWMNMAEAYKSIGSQDEAIESYRTVIDQYSDDTESRMQLASIYEVSGRRPEALELVDRVIELRKVHELNANVALTPPIGDAVEEGESSLFPNRSEEKNKRKRKSRAFQKRVEANIDREKRMVEQVTIKHQKLKVLRPEVNAGDKEAIKEWLDIAGDLVDDFRNTRTLYPAERGKTYGGFITTAKRRAKKQGLKIQLEKMQSRLQESLAYEEDDMPVQSMKQTTFRGLDYGTWLHIFLDYAICLTKHDGNPGAYLDAYDVCSAAKEANIFYTSREHVFLIWTTWLACAMHVQDAESCSTICRWFMTTYQFVPEAYSLFSTSIGISRGNLDSFNTNANQKYLLRQLKAMDEALDGKKRGGAALYTGIDENKRQYIPRMLDINLLMLYGNILAAGKSYVSALNYYSRAYTHKPRDPLVLFCIALAYLHRAMQRQSENRQVQVLQGVSFLFEYYDRRLELTEMTHREDVWAGKKQEAEYNLARAFHQLGLTHLSIPYYEKALAISEEWKERDGELNGDLKWEAAYNLQMVYFTSGNFRMAKIITERWLVV